MMSHDKDIIDSVKKKNAMLRNTVIGIDLDNTIINYEQLFINAAYEKGYIESKNQHSKQSIKRTLFNMFGSDRNWQKLQCQIYSKDIEKANAYSGAKAAISRLTSVCKAVYIISHKTALSNYDGTSRLREPALKWLKENKIVSDACLPEKNVYFESSRKEKLFRIKNTLCNIFIDDLSEVLLDDRFPDNVIPILFSHESCEGKSVLFELDSWKKIAESINYLSQISNSEHKQYIKKSGLNSVINIIEINHGGNNRVFRLVGEQKQLIIKSYVSNANDGRNRGLKEFSALQKLSELGLENTPKPYWLSKSSQFAAYEFIEKNKNSLTRNELICRTSEVYRKLYRLGSMSALSDFEKASQARFCLKDYMQAVEGRINELADGLNKIDNNTVIVKEAIEFLTTKIVPLKNQLTKEFISKVEYLGLDLDETFPKLQLLLSPSDASFQNSIYANDGKMYLLDLEYFGWDDYAKLLNDFIFHVANDIGFADKVKFIDNCLCSNKFETEIRERLNITQALVEIEWVLIILNVFSERVYTRLKCHETKNEITNIFSARLKLAKQRFLVLDTFPKSNVTNNNVVSRMVN